MVGTAHPTQYLIFNYAHLLIVRIWGVLVTLSARRANKINISVTRYDLKIGVHSLMYMLWEMQLFLLSLLIHFCIQDCLYYSNSSVQLMEYLARYFYYPTPIFHYMKLSLRLLFRFQLQILILHLHYPSNLIKNLIRLPFLQYLKYCNVNVWKDR